jgi:hypothetical protein
MFFCCLTYSFTAMYFTVYITFSFVIRYLRFPQWRRRRRYLNMVFPVKTPCSPSGAYHSSGEKCQHRTEDRGDNSLLGNIANHLQDRMASYPRTAPPLNNFTVDWTWKLFYGGLNIMHKTSRFRLNFKTFICVAIFISNCSPTSCMFYRRFKTNILQKNGLFRFELTTFISVEANSTWNWSPRFWGTKREGSWSSRPPVIKQRTSEQDSNLIPQVEASLQAPSPSHSRLDKITAGWGQSQP